jgi:MoxR-like ATPase
MADAEVRQIVTGSGNIFTATGDVRINYSLPPAEAEERRLLLQLTGSVKQFWIDGVLERSVHQAALIELSKTARPDAVRHPWGRVLELPGQPASAIGAERDIGAIFDDTGRALLLLGEPGSGKTITLLELARHLIGRFEKDPVQPACAVLNLSSWTAKQAALGPWIEAELKNKYFVPPKRSREWIAGSRLILLLDGLDEVAAESQNACVQAINRFVENTGVPGIVVCSRLADYLALPERLRFSGAVCLQPLTPAQVDRFLEDGGTQLSAVREAMKTDALLQNLARSPLLLNVIALAYRDSPVESLASQADETVGQRRNRVFRAYVRRMFQRAGQPPDEFPERRTRVALQWLAREMNQNSLTLFSLDQLQPNWLETRSERWAYYFISRLTCACLWPLLVWACSLAHIPGLHLLWGHSLVYALGVGVVVGVIAAVSDGLRSTRPARPGSQWQQPFVVLGLVLLYAFCTYFAAGAMATVFFRPIEPALLSQQGIPGWLANSTTVSNYAFSMGALFGSIFSLRSIRSSLSQDIWLSEARRLSWRAALRSARIFGLSGLVAGPVFTILVALAQPAKAAHPGLWTIAGALLLVGLYAGFAGAVFGAAFGMLAPAELPRRVQPVQWLQRSVASALFSGLCVAACFGLILIPLALARKNFESVAFASLDSCDFGIAAALWYGGFDALHHLTLRLLLSRRGRAIGHYVRFLDYAARLIFLQKVGSSYIFIHRQLLEYFGSSEAGLVEDADPVRNRASRALS